MVGGMSSEGSANKHRHDTGNPDHGPHYTEGVTKTIQGVLALAILATVIVSAYALFKVGTL